MNKCDISDDLPMIDISIVTHNSARWLPQFFKSLIKQHYPTQKINVYIRDNGSSDNTLQICSNLQLLYTKEFSEFHITSGKNIGFGSGHNCNIKKSSADYILVTNVDLEFEPDALLVVVNTALQNEKDVASWELRQKPYEHSKYYNPITLETTWSSNACILFRRAALEVVKGYEERIFLYGEDVELSYRLRDNGFKLKYCPKAVCWYYSYEHSNQLKSLQFFGSTLANVYIRMRYGSYLQIIQGFILYLALLIPVKRIPIPLVKQQLGVLKIFFILLKNTPYFLCTRKKSKTNFPFKLFDYAITRPGAFYAYQRIKIDDQKYPLVSVIVRTYQGRLGWLKEAVTSVLNQTYPNIQLIIVEDGSSEVSDFVSQLQGQGVLSSIIYHTIPRQGRCVAGNTGLTVAQGEYCCFLDDDDAFFADHIEVLVSAMLNNSQIAAAYSLSWQVLTKVVSADAFSYTETRHDLMYNQKFSRTILWHHNYMPIQSVLFKRELYLRYGGFDESLLYLEDWNLWTRYSLEHDFFMIDKLTSLYHVQADIDVTVKRQLQLVKYSDLAVQKQYEMKLHNVTLAEILAYTREVKSIKLIVNKVRNKLKKIILNNSLLHRYYYFFAKLGCILR